MVWCLIPAVVLSLWAWPPHLKVIPRWRGRSFTISSRMSVCMKQHVKEDVLPFHKGKCCSLLLSKPATPLQQVRAGGDCSQGWQRVSCSNPLWLGHPAIQLTALTKLPSLLLAGPCEPRWVISSSKPWQINTLVFVVWFFVWGRVALCCLNETETLL